MNPDPLDLAGSDAETFVAAMDVLQLLIQANIVALVTLDTRGVALIPRPGTEADTLRFLGEVNWKRLARIAEEHSV